MANADRLRARPLADIASIGLSGVHVALIADVIISGRVTLFHYGSFPYAAVAQLVNQRRS